MKTATVTAFRQKMKEHLDSIQNDQDFLILSGPKKTDFVVLTLETFNSMEETAHLLSTSANSNRLMESIAQDKLFTLSLTPRASPLQSSLPV
jgi:antitoxin YefM